MNARLNNPERSIDFNSRAAATLASTAPKAHKGEGKGGGKGKPPAPPPRAKMVEADNPVVELLIEATCRIGCPADPTQTIESCYGKAKTLPAFQDIENKLLDVKHLGNTLGKPKVEANKTVRKRIEAIYLLAEKNPQLDVLELIRKSKRVRNGKQDCNPKFTSDDTKNLGKKTADALEIFNLVPTGPSSPEPDVFFLELDKVLPAYTEFLDEKEQNAEKNKTSSAQPAASETMSSQTSLSAYLIKTEKTAEPLFAKECCLFVVLLWYTITKNCGNMLEVLFEDAIKLFPGSVAELKLQGIPNQPQVVHTLTTSLAISCVDALLASIIWVRDMPVGVLAGAKCCVRKGFSKDDCAASDSPSTILVSKVEEAIRNPASMLLTNTTIKGQDSECKESIAYWVGRMIMIRLYNFQDSKEGLSAFKILQATLEMYKLKIDELDADMPQIRTAQRKINTTYNIASSRQGIVMPLWVEFFKATQNFVYLNNKILVNIYLLVKGVRSPQNILEISSQPGQPTPLRDEMDRLHALLVNWDVNGVIGPAVHNHVIHAYTYICSEKWKTDMQKLNPKCEQVNAAYPLRVIQEGILKGLQTPTKYAADLAHIETKQNTLILSLKEIWAELPKSTARAHAGYAETKAGTTGQADRRPAAAPAAAPAAVLLTQTPPAITQAQSERPLSAPDNTQRPAAVPHVSASVYSTSTPRVSAAAATSAPQSSIQPSTPLLKQPGQLTPPTQNLGSLPSSTSYPSPIDNRLRSSGRILRRRPLRYYSPQRQKLQQLLRFSGRPPKRKLLRFSGRTSAVPLLLANHRMSSSPVSQYAAT